MKKPNPTLTDEDNPPLTPERIRKMRPAREVFAELGIPMPRLRGPQKTPTKQLVAIRLDRDLVETMKASGRGWQTRANEKLRAAYGVRTRTQAKVAAPKRTATKSTGARKSAR